MVYFDTKRLPLLQNQKATDQRDALFVSIDDYSSYCMRLNFFYAHTPLNTLTQITVRQNG